VPPVERSGQRRILVWTSIVGYPLVAFVVMRLPKKNIREGYLASLPARLLGWVGLWMVLVPSGAACSDFWERPIPRHGPAPAFAIGNPVVADLAPSACGVCHIPQLEAWRGSLHALALSPGVLGQLDALDGATQDDCLSCHAPREEMRDRWRDQGLAGAGQMAGVDCATCHVRDHVRHGPRSIPITPHGAVEALPLYRQSEFCAPCHQFDETGLSVNGKPLENTLEEWRQSRYARDGVTCQACHMPERRHSFKGIHDPEMTRQGLGVDVGRTAEGLRVLVKNRGAGHALPTYVTPRILVDLAGPGAGPRLRHVIARTMRWSQEEGWEELADTRLLPDESVELELPLAQGEGGEVRVRVEPGYDYAERIYPTLLALWSDTLSSAERGLLEQAREAAGQSAYTLYRFTCPPWDGREGPCPETP
jgi:hypothetical protein